MMILIMRIMTLFVMGLIGYLLAIKGVDPFGSSIGLIVSAFALHYMTEGDFMDQYVVLNKDGSEAAKFYARSQDDAEIEAAKRLGFTREQLKLWGFTVEQVD